jgi:DNA polymerase III psi subunit
MGAAILWKGESKFTIRQITLYSQLSQSKKLLVWDLLRSFILRPDSINDIESLMQLVDLE